MANGRMQGYLVLGERLSVTDTRSCILRWHRSPLLFVLMMKHVTSVHFPLRLIILYLSRLTVTVCGLVSLTTEQQNPRLTKLDVFFFSSVFWSVLVSGDPEKEGMVNKRGCQGEVSGERKEGLKKQKHLYYGFWRIFLF